MLLQYLLESSICLTLFYGLYQFALRKQTFFHLNRWYLLLMPVLALLIPLAEWEWGAVEPGAVTEYVMPVWTEWEVMDYSVQEAMARPAPGLQVQLNDVMLALYIAGAFFLFLQLLRRLLDVYLLIWRSKKRYEANFILVETPKAFPAASFFSYVFWRDSGTEKDEVILAHENVHVRQRHSLDVILMECLVILLWFNPLIYLFRRTLKETHEYIADAYVSRQMGSSHQYARYLLMQHLPTEFYSLTHSFAAMLPKRLKMLGEPRSAFWRYFTYLFVIPIIGLMVILFAYNFSGKLSPELSDRLNEAQSKLNRWGNTTVYAENADHVGMELGWSGESCHCYPGQFPTYYYCENVYLSIKKFKDLFENDHWFSLYEGGEEVLYEIKTMTSKRQLTLGNGFLDITSLKDHDVFWRDVQKGDVLYIAAQTESGKWTEFNVFINPNGKLAFPFYDVYIGDLRIPIEVNNMTAAKHVDRATFESLRKEKIKLLKNGKEWVRFWTGPRTPGYVETRTKEWRKEVPLQDFMPNPKKLDMNQNSVRLRLAMQNGKDVTVTILAAQGPFGEKEEGTHQGVEIAWGDLQLVYKGGIYMKCTNFWKERLQKPFRIFVNGEERTITDFGHMEVLKRNHVGAYFYPNEGKKTPLTSMNHLNRFSLQVFEENNWDPDMSVLLKGLKTDQGEEFSLYLHSSGSEHCESDLSGFINSYRHFRSSSEFIFTYDFSNFGMDQFIWETYVKSANLLPSQKRATYFLNEEKIDFEKLDQIDRSTIRSLTLMKPTYAKQQYGEIARYGAVLINTK